MRRSVEFTLRLLSAVVVGELKDGAPRPFPQPIGTAKK
jgi:hypothetical protein